MPPALPFELMKGSMRMPHEVPVWQKSSHSSQGNNCIQLAAGGGARVLLRESDEPETVLAADPERLRALLNLASDARV